MNEHPSLDIQGSESSLLKGKTIVLGMTGSVGVTKSVDLARKLIRQGADVWPVMTKAAQELIHPNLLHWATGHKPITELTGDIEHVSLVGNVPVHADLLLIAPATANTVGKMAHGIDDSPVTTFFTTAFGEKIPVVLVPAMHRSMYDHPFVVENLKKLETYGVVVVLPRLEEGKAKVPNEAAVVDAVVQTLEARAYRPLAGKKVVITAGRTVEYLDPIRVLTNNSTGKMGMALAQAAAAWGAEVTVVAGKITAEVPPGVRLIDAPTSDAMYQACETLTKAEKPDLFLACAAVGDWKPKETATRKLPTASGSLILELVPTAKILDQVKLWSPTTFVTAFRAQAGLDDEELEQDAAARLQKAGADLIASNDTARPGVGFESDTNALTVLDRSGVVGRIGLASKGEVARRLLALILERL